MSQEYSIFKKVKVVLENIIYFDVVRKKSIVQDVSFGRDKYIL